MAAEEGNKIGDMELPMSLIMLADPLLSACSWYAVRERFMRCTILFIGRECSDIDSFTPRQVLRTRSPGCFPRQDIVESRR